MKKFITIMIAALIMTFSTVTAFASINSPVATAVPDSQSKGDTSKTSPKTGSNDILAYTLIGLAIAGCGAASVALVKSANKE